jgi:hypothetical protein
MEEELTCVIVDTEYLPSDLIRSLTLIRKLDDSYLQSTTDLHELTKEYGSLPSQPVENRSDPKVLRARISHFLNRAIGARESSYAEASRLYDVVDRHFNRLTSIISKLQALPLPPSRDPTPAPQPVKSPQTNRGRGRKTDVDATTGPRITLRLDGARTGPGPGRPLGTISRLKSRNRRITIPGEVLPPPNPDSPPPSTESDWESEPRSPVPIPTSRVGVPSRSRGKPGRVKIPKLPKPDRIKIPKGQRGRRPAGAMGTNAHSSVAGISSSNALALLNPPPENAVAGSEDAPWLKLTPYELARLRKRMKKNAVWQPSDTMIARELKSLGRGVEAWRAAKAKADAAGEPFPSGDGVTIEGADGGGAGSGGKKPLAEGEIRPDALGIDEVQLSNRGMKLNQAKKMKKEAMARAAAEEAAAQAELAAKRLADAGRGFRGIFAESNNDMDESVTVGGTLKEKEAEKPKMNRKKRPEEATKPMIDAETIKSEADPQAAKSSRKRRRETPAPITTSITSTTTVPLAAPGPSSASTTGTPVLPLSPSQPKNATSNQSHRRQTSVTTAPTSPPPPPSRPRSRGVAASAEPPTTASSIGKDRPRRASTASVAATPQPVSIRRRRGKLPAPGPVTASGDGGTTLSVGKRKAAPRKRAGKKPKSPEDEKIEDKGGLGAEVVGDEEEDMEIDPNEPTYCLCDRVSFGLMVMCENGDVSVLSYWLEYLGQTCLQSPIV